MIETQPQPQEQASQRSPAPNDTPLCVDLDGTLVATDTLWESLLQIARKRPGDLVKMPGWIAAGRAAFKEKVAARAKLDAGSLPYRVEVLEILRAEKEAGRRLVLATAAHRKIAEPIAAHLGLFDEVLASGEGVNLKGATKLSELEKRYGAGNFDYVGDSTADLCLWKSARRAYVVSSKASLLGKAKGVCAPYQVIDAAPGLKPVIKALRPHQWVKNLLLFVPLILAHQVTHWPALFAAIFAFWAFSFCASAIYIINDLLDLESDRRHPTKRNRPFAAGKLSAPMGLAMSAALLLTASLMALMLPWRFDALLGLYVILTTAYSFWLKRKLLVDVILLAGLYTHRIVAGAAAVSVELTMWLLAFSMFFFLSLAFAKRYSELVMVEEAGEEQIRGRGYEVRDLRVIESIGPASGYLAVLVFCNYLDSHEVKRLYPHPHWLWLVAPVLLYWITRIWFIARRRQLHDDPIIFAIRDGRSHWCGLMVGLIVIAASMHWFK